MSNLDALTAMPLGETAVHEVGLPVKPMTDVEASIESGLSGRVLYLLEQYAFTGDVAFLQKAGDGVATLVSYCETSFTRDYSLYKGRGGVVYAIIQYYCFIKDVSLVRRCEVFMRPATGDYLQSKWTSDHLYDGRAGTLLVLWMLSQVADNATELRQAIQLFLDKIIADAHLSPSGLYWTKDAEAYPAVSCGMAFGTAGILYVLRTIAGEEPGPALRWILEQGVSHLASHWDGSKKGWGHHSMSIGSASAIKIYKDAFIGGEEAVFGPVYASGWASGAAGIAAGLRTDLPESQSLEAFTRLVDGFAGFDQHDLSLFSGAAGIGLMLRESGRLSGPVVFPFKESIEDGGGLMRGGLGVAYFLTRSSNAASPLRSILEPGLPLGLAVVRYYGYDVPLSAVRKRLLSAHYPRTVELLEAVDPKGWLSLISLAPSKSPELLFDWFGRLLREKGTFHIQPGVHDRLLDVYQLENAKALWRWETERKPLNSYVAGLVYRDRASAWLNHPDSWLRQQSLLISPAIKILTSRWDWGCKGDHKVEYHKGIATYHLGNLQKPGRRYEYLIQYTPGSGVEECYLKPDTLMLMHQFDRPRRVEAAIENISRYIASMPDEMLKQLLEGLSEFVDVARFRKHIGSDILFQLRQWIFRNVLVIQE